MTLPKLILDLVVNIEKIFFKVSVQTHQILVLQAVVPSELEAELEHYRTKTVKTRKNTKKSKDRTILTQLVGLFDLMLDLQSKKAFLEENS